MSVSAAPTIPQLTHLPTTLPQENAVRIELVEGVLVFRASIVVQDRIEDLLDAQKSRKLTKQEVRELDLYEEVDDYLSYVNRTIRNQHYAQSTQKLS